MRLELGPCTRKSKVHARRTLSLPSTVHNFRSTTTSIDISHPRYSFVACACARRNELKTGGISILVPPPARVKRKIEQIKARELLIKPDEKINT